jgi:hypothetical protein
MELVQIGVTRQKTVLQLIYELSERQSYEIEQLKRSAYERAERRRNRAKINRKSHVQ